jgi:hypothetical protein
LFGVIGKIFGKKKSEFFLEIKDDGSEAIVSPAKEAEAPTPVATAGETASAPAASEQPVAAAPVAATPPTPPSTAVTDTAALIRAAVSKPASKPVEAAAEGPTFATDYLITPANGSRRRPGPSLDAFKSMAKGMR